MRIVYVMSKPAHLPYLIVSLRSLRRWWSGRVYVYAWPETFKMLGPIIRDQRLDVRAVEWQPEYRGKNSQFECKQHVIQSMPGSDMLTLYLDADTLVMADPTPLFKMAEPYDFLATQFCRWNTQGQIIQGRVKRLRGFPGIDQAAVGSILRYKWPSVNGGVFITRPGSPILEVWRSWTRMARGVFISDETALHAVMASRRDDFGVVMGGAWNCSCRENFQSPLLLASDVKLWHFHGDSNTRPTKSLRGVLMWWREFWDCFDENIGGMRGWVGDIKHKYFRKLYREFGSARSMWELKAKVMAKEKQK